MFCIVNLFVQDPFFIRLFQTSQTISQSNEEVIPLITN